MVNFISLNPDTHTFSGHYFFYDFNLMKLCQQHSVEFFSLCWKETSGINKELEQKFLRTFSNHSWTIGNKGLEGAPAEITARFERELRDGIVKVKHLTGDEPTILYMYTGSLHHAELINKLVVQEEGLTAVINLFWLPFFDIVSLDFRKRWSTFLRMISQSSKMRLTVTTVEMQEIVEKTFGIRFSVSPHPNTSFSDHEFLTKQIHEPKTIVSPKSFKILFPGRVSSGKIGLEKGYLLMVDTVIKLSAYQSSHPHQCRVRKFPDVKQPQAHQAIKKLERVADFVDGDLSGDEFINMLGWADIIVLPYYKSAFARRTSGLFTDAIYLGKPVVSLQGTWMGNRIEEFGCGSVAKSDDPQSFVEAIIEVIKTYEACVNNAIDGSSSWFQCNSWLSLFCSILSVLRIKKRNLDC